MAKQEPQHQPSSRPSPLQRYRELERVDAEWDARIREHIRRLDEWIERTKNGRPDAPPTAAS